MNCVYCNSSQVKVANTGTGAKEIIRIRKCLDCGKTFYTSEKPVDREGQNTKLVIYKKGYKND